MLKKLEASDEQQLYLDIISRASQRIDILVNEITGKNLAGHEKMGEHSIHQLLEEVLVIAGDSIRLKNITICKDYSPGNYSIRENRPELRIALTNIIINAVDAMKEGQGILKLVTTSIDSNYVLTIEDNGCGISAADLKHIFRPFFTRKKDGLGVGLAVTRHILKVNKIKIDVESKEGGGTKFILSFKKTAPVFVMS